jgi:integrase
VFEQITIHPARVRGGGQAEKVHETVVATIHELAVATEAMPEHLRLAVTLAAWTHVRFGELTELRRKDIDIRAGVINVRRGDQRAPG